jgi:acyl-CoA reductase-like NAD-dependent aldehyde dehydrogenase
VNVNEQAAHPSMSVSAEIYGSLFMRGTGRSNSILPAIFTSFVGQCLKQSHNNIRKNLSFSCALQYCFFNSTRTSRMGQGIEIERDPSTGIGYILDKNPSDGSLIQKVPCSTRGEINAKIESLQEKQSTWTLVPLEERVQLLRNAVKHLLIEKDDLATLISQEMGKTLPESRAELDDIEELTGTSLDLMKQANEPQVVENACIVRDPLGVIAILSPWNFPAAEIIFHLLPALVAGNAVVVKPSEVVPLVGQFVISKLLQYSTSGLPVALPIDIVQGDGEVGEALVMHDGIHAVCMTGSSAVGKKVMENCGKRLKRVILEVSDVTLTDNIGCLKIDLCIYWSVKS